MVNAVSSQASDPIQEVRSGRQMVVWSGRQVSNFVAGGSDSEKYYKMVKVIGILTLVLPLIALAHGNTGLAGITFTAGAVSTVYSFMNMYMSS